MNRYPGIRPFRQDERPLFFGRNADTERLLRLVRNEQTVVLYGKSGYGKSSLLNAGLYPRLAEEGRSQCWEVRFGPYKKGESALPADAVCNVAHPSGSDLIQIFPRKVFGQNLWQALKSRQAAEGNTRFILFFDQFEELFTYPPEQVLAFRQQLAEALYNATPETAVHAFEQSKGLNEKTEALLYAPFELKVVFSIRADRMSLLKQLEDYLPNLLRHSFLLEALDEKQATEAVLMPACLPKVQEGYSFDTDPFGYAPETLAAIFRELRDSSGRIETSALQIVCKHVEDNIVAKRNADGTDLTTFQKLSNLHRESTNPPITITPSDLGELKAVFRAFYDNTIAALDPTEQPAARSLVEDVLIKDGIRLPFVEQALLTEPGVTIPLLEKLERASLLRVELDEQRRKIYEVGHDTLVTPIEEAAKARREAEAEASERERLRLQAEARERELAEERRKFAQARRRNFVLSLLALFAIAASVFAFFKQQQASQALDKAEKSQQQAEQNLALATQREQEANTAKGEAEANLTLAKENEAKAGENFSLATQREKEANQAKAEALKNYQIAEFSRQVSETAKQEALINLLKSQESAEQARIAREEAEQNLQQFEAASERVGASLVREANDLIYQLNYFPAAEKLKTALQVFKKPNQGHRRASLEVVYFFNESGNVKMAADMLDSLLLSGTKSLPSTQSAFRDYLSTIDPEWYTELQGRYYPKMLALKGGTFDMSDQYKATVSDFQLAETETTFFQYALFCTASKRPIKRHRPPWGLNGDHAATQLSWYDACLYANWLSKQMKLDTVYVMSDRAEARVDGWSETYTVTINEKAKGFRLPTEAEWQFAAGGGEFGLANGMTKWAGTSTADSLEYFANISGEEDGFKYTSPAGHYLPNALGLYDMSGNVWEWCWDRGADYPPEAKTDWRGPDEGSGRVLRGGSWNYYPEYCRVAYRYGSNPDNRASSLGFRVVRGY